MSRTEVATVTSQTNPLAYMKAIATLIGSIVTGLLGVYTADTPVGQVLTVVAIIATAIATWRVPNALVVPATIHTDTEGQVEVEPDEDYADDGLDYEQSGGIAYPPSLGDPTPYAGDDPYNPVDGGSTEPNRY